MTRSECRNAEKVKSESRRPKSERNPNSEIQIACGAPPAANRRTPRFAGAGQNRWRDPHAVRERASDV
jgi:hypothetical protein